MLFPLLDRLEVITDIGEIDTDANRQASAALLDNLRW